jgi:pyruvate dehydrogenase (quinone)
MSSHEKTLSDALVERLIEWGVDTIFGLPGDNINGLIEALRKARERIRFIHVRHETVGALAAVGYAKFSGKIGVCIATAGPGAAHLLNGILDAHLDRVPLLAITGLTFHDLNGSEGLQAADADKMFAPFTLFNERVIGPAQVEGVVDTACRRALAMRGPVHLTVPSDFQSQPMSEGKVSPENVPHHTAPGFELPKSVPESELLEKAARWLSERRRIVILAGTGARGASTELLLVAEKLGAPITKAMLGKDVIPDDHPYCIGGTGHTATTPSKLAMDEADALLIVGSTMPFLHWYPKPGQVLCVQIDDKPERIGMRYPVDVGLAGDSQATLKALLPLLERNEDRSFLETAQERMNRWWQLMEEQGTNPALPMKPQVPTWTVSEQMADDAIFCTDAGTVAYWTNRSIRIRGEQRFSVSGASCTMGAGLSYAIGAQAAFPGRQVIAFIGDGAATMFMGDLLTLAQHGLPVKVIVIKNNSLGLERWEQMSFLGNPEYGNDLFPADFALVAQACGIGGVRIEEAGACREQMQRALASLGPMLVECVVDPNEPAHEMPLVGAHAENYVKALEKGTDDAQGVASGLLGSLRHEQRVMPEAIDDKTEALMEKLKAVSGEP